ncbi:hypothetical protein GWI33_013360 [Rhynchophorus ferrugineus]|uniref:Uncharacterized protein n=1 Tax=Rhynchophorus ferrugineus TaxID=354439 RepID=A0A834I4S1_RHYFE|nr:hypothetical protein GWI33_013360 [Rhynchophorus ferrugineus]
MKTTCHTTQAHQDPCVNESALTPSLPSSAPPRPSTHNAPAAIPYYNVLIVLAEIVGRTLFLRETAGIRPIKGPLPPPPHTPTSFLIHIPRIRGKGQPRSATERAVSCCQNKYCSVRFVITRREPVGVQVHCKDSVICFGECGFRARGAGSGEKRTGTSSMPDSGRRLRRPQINLFSRAALLTTPGGQIQLFSDHLFPISDTHHLDPGAVSSSGVRRRSGPVFPQGPPYFNGVLIPAGQCGRHGGDGGEGGDDGLFPVGNNLLAMAGEGHVQEQDVLTWKTRKETGDRYVLSPRVVPPSPLPHTFGGVTDHVTEFR